MTTHGLMDFSYSPAREAGGTIHLSSAHAHHVDPAVVRNLRRSLSRSPSRHHLATSRSPHRPLRFSATAPNTPHHQSNRHHASVDDFHLPSAKKPRQNLRRTTPLSFSLNGNSLSDTSPHRAPGALSDSSDNGNATNNHTTTPSASPPSPAGGQENCDPTHSQESSGSGDEFVEKSPLSDFGPPQTALPVVSRVPTFRNHHRTFRPAKSSPLKRSDAVMTVPQEPPASPSAKRRTICGGVVSSPFGAMPWDNDLYMSDHDADDSEDDNPSPVSHRSSLPPKGLTLRRTKPFVRPSERSASPARPNLDLVRDSLGHSKPPLRTRPHLATGFLASPAAVGNQRTEQGFADLPDHNRAPYARPTRSQPHPLSKTLSPTSPTPSSKEQPVKQPIPFFQGPLAPTHDFSKSLPIGALRPEDEQGHSSKPESQQSSFDSSFATPKFYHIAKPDPAAFRSTGLISKKHRNPDDVPPFQGAHPGMPDTPCKRIPGAFTFSASPTPTNSAVKEQRFSQPSFGTPSKPLVTAANAAADRSHQGTDLFGTQLATAGLIRKESIASADGEDGLQSPQGQADSQSSADELPPTPTKQAIGVSTTISKQNSLRSTLLGRKPSVSPGTFIAPEAPDTDPAQADLFVHPLSAGPSNGSVPQTPIDNSVPDPSGLSISPNFRKVSSPIGNGSFTKPTSYTPATPTHREGLAAFGLNRPMMTPSNHAFAQDVDPVLSRRFHKVEWYGRGNFSEVYKVSESSQPVPVQSYFSSAVGSSSAAGSSHSPVPDKLYIVKKTKTPYTSMTVRQKTLREAAVMSALGKNDHTVQLINSWEAHGHIYLQTEFCEEGSLEQFLTKIGIKGRLDDFRIWKILVELSEGLQHIHDSGFIHLDLKPANVFIDFAGVLKIGDFGLATEWPASSNVEGEGDRRYIGPDLLQGALDKPADIFSLGMMMFEIAGNCELPDNGTYWHRLRSGIWSDLPSLTSVSSSSESQDSRDEMFTWGSPQALTPADAQDKLSYKATPGLQSWNDDFKKGAQTKVLFEEDTVQPPSFMQDPEDPESLEHVVHWMMQPQPADRPVIAQIVQAGGCRWVDQRRRAGAVVFEGPSGPPDHVLASYGHSLEDQEMLDAP